MLREERQDRTVRQDVTLEMALVDRVIEEERRFKPADVSAVVGQQLFARDEFDPAVPVQIRQGHRMKRGKLRLDPVLGEGALPVADLLFVPRQAVLMGRADDDVGKTIAVRVGHDDRMARPAARERVVGVPDPFAFRRLRRSFEPAGRRDHVVAAVSVDVPDAAAVTDADMFRPQLVLLEPRRVVDVLHPDQAPAGSPCVVVDQQVLVALARQVPDHQPLEPRGFEDRVRFPFGAERPRVLIPVDALFEHPAGTDHVHAAVVVDVHRAFVVVVDVRSVRRRPGAIVGVLRPVRRDVVVPTRRDVQLPVAVDIQHRRALGERPEPVRMIGRIMHGPVDLDRHEDKLARPRRHRRRQHQGDQDT